ncbi:hypothetical protein CAEBREN_03408 [Caenorhabditis brenneri]|uniref:Uncharacterized protein n=1 Tax=Caenorhabditis brenneri TaxID=135651 RepID=G0M864_CAEBE|nr:hypothetical protein CAEBREN_03408 [Caenorhabditis brenneri]
MSFKMLTIVFFFLQCFIFRTKMILAAQPKVSEKTSFVLGVYLFLKLQKLSFQTLRVGRYSVRRQYNQFPGQVVVETARQGIRVFFFMFEFVFMFMYSRVIACICETPSARNSVNAYTILFLLVLTWEHLLFRMCEKRAIRYN